MLYVIKNNLSYLIKFMSLLFYSKKIHEEKGLQLGIRNIIQIEAWNSLI